MADIVGGAETTDTPGAGGAILGGPTVVPMDVVPFPMLVADATGRALAVNLRWAELSGLGRERSLGYGWLSVLRPEDRLALRSQVERVAAGDGDLRADYAWLPTAGGRAIWWLAAHQRAGERVVGIAVGSVVGAGPAAEVEDPVRAEMAALLASVGSLLDTLDRLVEAMSPVGARPPITV